MVVVGIDPGVNGAIARLNVDDETGEARVESVVDIKAIPVNGRRQIDRAWLAQAIYDAGIPHDEADPDTLFIVEEQQVFGGQGVISMGTLMYGYGLILGVLAAYKGPVITVRPKEWKRAHNIPGKKTVEQKRAGVVLAKQLFPGTTFETIRGRMLDGRSDACLIALYGIREMVYGRTHRTQLKR